MPADFSNCSPDSRHAPLRGLPVILWTALSFCRCRQFQYLPQACFPTGTPAPIRCVDFNPCQLEDGRRAKPKIGRNSGPAPFFFSWGLTLL
ncbi:MAG: hypothetical protein KME26_22120 [Oscillatoria princeps RMCB-10]|nr:hypothetical protein [Oscillatoria princeps RMCB-10]